MTQAKIWTISELANELGMTKRAIRFYEDKGLLQPQRIGTNRVYNYQDRARLRLALRGKRLGFSLEEIREFIDLYHTDISQVSQAQYLLARLKDKQAQLRQQQADLETMLSELAGIEVECLSLLQPTLKTNH